MIATNSCVLTRISYFFLSLDVNETKKPTITKGNEPLLSTVIIGFSNRKDTLLEQVNW